MIAFLVFAAICFVFIIGVLLYYHPKTPSSSIPGPEISDPKDGNIVDIKEAGGLHHYLETLHSCYGKIVSFCIGEQLVVSTACPTYFKDYKNAFDKSSLFVRFLSPLIGDKNVLFTNGLQGRLTRKSMQYFSNADVLSAFALQFEITNEDLTRHLAAKPPDQHIPVNEYMTSLSVKAVGTLLFGTNVNEKLLFKLGQTYEVCMKEAVARHYDVPLDPSDPREKRFKEEIGQFLDTLGKLYSGSQNKSGGRGDEIKVKSIADILNEENKQGKVEYDIIHELAAFMVSGVNPLANLLTSVLYYIASEDGVQQSVYNELQVSGNIQDYIRSDNYVHKVILETLRLSPPVPYTNRCRDADVMIDQHTIEKNTPVLQALGVVFKDEEYFPCHDVFNPNRFEDITQTSEDCSEFKFCPFGFAGNRSCPFQKLSIVFVKLFVASLCRRFRVVLVPGQKHQPRFGWVNSQESELWVTLKVRG